VFPKSFDYFAPASIEETLDLLERYADDARVLAGGQSLIPLMKLRFLFPAQLIDLNRIPRLNDIEEQDNAIRCGAMVRHVEIERSTALRRHVPLLGHAVGEIADVQVRNRGTLGGALAQADPAGDWATACLALGARMRCLSKRGERFVNAAEFFTDTYTTALSEGELLTDVFFPKSKPSHRAAYIKIHRRTGDFAIASAAVQLDLDNESRCKSIGIGMGGVGATPLRPLEVVGFLAGKPLSEDIIEEAVSMLPAAVDPIADVRGSADYKRKVAAVALRRALIKARDQGQAHAV
jgi:carbon-monoxide dehydrogenase medium subunit